MGFDFIVIAPLLSSHCGFSFVFACAVSFLLSSNVFLLMIFHQLAVILVFSKEGLRARPSTLSSCVLTSFHSKKNFLILCVGVFHSFFFQLVCASMSTTLLLNSSSVSSNSVITSIWYFISLLKFSLVFIYFSLEIIEHIYGHYFLLFIR